MDKDARIAELEKTIGDLKARADIYDCLVRYCRGVDRNDPELIMTAFHPDAIDDHGAFCGPPAVIAESALHFHNTNHKRTQHLIANVYYEIDGDVAHTETYYHYAGLNNDDWPTPVALVGGRYLDRFERRNGKWAIALRQSLIEWYGTPGEPQAPPGGLETFNVAFMPTRDRNDPSYKRPYAIAPGRLGVGIEGWVKK